MDFQKIEIFICVSQLGSLSKASTALDILPSIISRQISILEKSCQGRLFHRTGRGMTLTDLGKRLLPRALAMLHEYKNFEAEIKSNGNLISGQVRIGLVPSVAQAISEKLFREVHKKYPSIRLSFIEGVSAQLDFWRSNDEVDITILFRASNSDLRSEENLVSVGAYLVGWRGDNLTSKSSVRFSDIAGIPLVLAPVPNGLRSDIEKQAKRISKDLNIVLETNSLAIQTELAAKGCAYTIMAGHAANQRMNAGLQASRIIEPSISRTISLSMPTHRPVSDVTRLVAHLARKIVMECFVSTEFSGYLNSN